MKQDRCLIFSFFLILGAFFALYFVPAVHNENSSEKRELASFPKLSLSEITSFPTGVEAWINDHFPFRSTWVRFHSTLEHELFGKFSSANVLVGEDDWFFYAPRKQSLVVSEDVSAINDHKGFLLPTEAGLEAICQDLTAFRDRLAERGIEFQIILSPNKANVYAEQLPGYIRRSDSRERADSAAAYLWEHSDLDLFYAKPALMAAKKTEPHPLYYKYDSHWNLYGSWIAANAFAREFLETELPRPQFIFDETHEGELADMVSLGGHVRETQHVSVPEGSIPAYTIERNWGRWTNREYIPGENVPQRETSLLVIGDSFGEAFFPWLLPYYSQISFRRFDNDYGFYDIKDVKPDVVILELTERFFTPEIIHRTVQAGGE